MTIGIVGLGFVGTACVAGFMDSWPISTFDVDETKHPNCSSIDELVSKTAVVFVCVPTPSLKSGKCDTSIVERVVKSIADAAKLQNRDMEVIIKSTVPPGTTDELQIQFPHLRMIFNPEFLTEANFINDFKNQKQIVLGFAEFWWDRPCTTESIYHAAFPNTPQIKTLAREAEMLKYVTNCFLAIKVIYANQIKALCESDLNISYEKLVDMVKSDDRLGQTHWTVPGPDGHFGFGGSCFPKDVRALLYVGRYESVDLSLLQTAWESNLKIRPEKDWEQLKGRAVSDS
jgi:nucleotide sugar dehydrogenase